MNIKEYKTVIPYLLKHNVVPFVWGAKGIGKTEIHRQIVDEMGDDNGFVSVYLGANADMGDVLGLLMDNKDGTVSHTPPGWLKKTFTGKGVIFLDEFNRCPPDIKQAMFPFILKGTIGPHQKGDGWKIVVAGNYQNDKYTVESVDDEALISRFCHIDLKPTVEEFTSYASDRGFDVIADFIREQPKMLGNSNGDSMDISVSPNPRAWIEFVGPLEGEPINDSLRFEIYSGIVGATATVSFLNWKKTEYTRLKLTNILNRYEDVRPQVLKAAKDKDTRFDILSSPIDEFMDKVSKDSNLLLEEYKLRNFKQFLCDMPKELLAQTAKRLGKVSFHGKRELTCDPVYVKQLMRG